MAGFSTSFAQTDDPACAVNRVVFAAVSGPVSIQVEIADNAETRARGLMFREHLPVGHGMLFVYDHPQPMAFWMKNTLIPLDIIFLDRTGTIRHIHPMAQPLDETPIPGATPDDQAPERLLALEIAGGEAARLGLMPGQAMRWPGLDQRFAALPCP